MSHIQTKIWRALPPSGYSSKEPGQSIVVIALMLVGIVAMLGLVLDGGNAYFQRRRTQNAADSAAFGGAIALANPAPGAYPSQIDASVLAAVNQYATANGISNPGTNIVANYIDLNGGALTQVGLGNVPGNAKGVQVVPTLPFNTFFLGVVGNTTGAVKAIAKASFAPLSSPQSLGPLGPQCTKAVLTDCFTFNQANVPIWDGSQPGNFGWMSWNGSNSANYLKDELIPGNPVDYQAPNNHPCSTGSKISVGCWVQGSPGVEASAKDNLQTYWVNTGDVMIIPIWDQTTGNGSNANYHIVGFAAFIVTDFRLTGQGYVKGTFKNYVSAGDLCTSGCMTTGLSGVHLRP